MYKYIRMIEMPRFKNDMYSSRDKWMQEYNSHSFLRKEMSFKTEQEAILLNILGYTLRGTVVDPISKKFSPVFGEYVLHDKVDGTDYYWIFYKNLDVFTSKIKEHTLISYLNRIYTNIKYVDDLYWAIVEMRGYEEIIIRPSYYDNKNMSL